jgi:hypothetical protein
MMLYDVGAVAILAFAGFGFGLHGVALWPAVVLHAVMTVWCVACLRRRQAKRRSNNKTEVMNDNCR